MLDALPLPRAILYKKSLPNYLYLATCWPRWLRILNRHLCGMADPELTSCQEGEQEPANDL